MDIRKYFLESEYLQRFIPNFSYRDYQADLSEYIMKALADYNTTVIEAPTGSGKTLAYLLPVFELGRKTIISTKTKQLMSQVLNNDIPTVSALFPDKDTDVVSLKGRKNYFCYYRYFKFITPDPDMYPDVIRWYERNAPEISEIPQYLFDFSTIEKMTADSLQCIGGKCPYFEVCPFYLKKAEAADADIVVTNHFMLLSDMGMRYKNDMVYNFEFADNIIFDEAHSLPDIFPQFIGDDVNFGSLMSFLKENRSVMNESIYSFFQNKFAGIRGALESKKVINDKIQGELEIFFSELKSLAESDFDDENYELYKKYRDKFKNIFSTDGIRLIEPYKNSFSLKSLPLSVSDSFEESLRKICVSSIFISATLSVNGSFDYFCNELGLFDVNTKKVEDGGDFLKNGVCCIPGKEFYREEKLETYASIIKKIEGGCLIIFNSLEMMNKVYNYLRMKKTGRQLILQTEVDLSQIDITGKTVILGCSIVREGIDFSGNNLKYVILDKLPFENISDVYLNARKEAFEKEYGNAFMNFYLPRAVIYFKQAVGRLIRHENDTGAWIILDNRVLTKTYGKYFMDVLKDVQVCHRLSDLPSFAGGNNELH